MTSIPEIRLTLPSDSSDALDGSQSVGHSPQDSHHTEQSGDDEDTANQLDTVENGRLGYRTPSVGSDPTDTSFYLGSDGNLGQRSESTSDFLRQISTDVSDVVPSPSTIEIRSTEHTGVRFRIGTLSNYIQSYTVMYLHALCSLCRISIYYLVAPVEPPHRLVFRWLFDIKFTKFHKVTQHNYKVLY